jgi:hypothetical protein
MSVAVLLMGRVGAPAKKTSKAGKDYAAANVRVTNGNEIEFWSALTFGGDALEALLGCTEGETVALQGAAKFEASGTDEEGRLKIRRTLFVDAILSARPKPRARKPKADKPARPVENAAAPLLEERGGRPFDDAIPF